MVLGASKLLLGTTSSMFRSNKIGVRRSNVGARGAKIGARTRNVGARSSKKSVLGGGTSECGASKSSLGEATSELGTEKLPVAATKLLLGAATSEPGASRLMFRAATPKLATPYSVLRALTAEVGASKSEIRRPLEGTQARTKCRRARIPRLGSPVTAVPTALTVRLALRQTETTLRRAPSMGVEGGSRPDHGGAAEVPSNSTLAVCRNGCVSSGLKSRPRNCPFASVAPGSGV
jgi:hypothetical protein